MRLRSIALIPALSIVVACGGGGGDPDARPHIDSRPTPDAGAACLLKPTYDVSLGSMANPATFGGSFGKDMATGNWVVAVYGSLNMFDMAPELGNHGITIILVDNTGMFATNNFAGPLLDTAVPVDGGATCGGCVEGYGGQPTDNPPSSTTNIPTQVFTADSGTLTMTKFDPIVDDGTTLTDVAGSFENVVMTGLDFATGDPLVPACSTTVNLGFYFRATFDSTPTVAPTNAAHQPHGIDWATMPKMPLVAN
jgi:hypothetical protein